MFSCALWGQGLLKSDFILDSLGCNGLRQKHVKASKVLKSLTKNAHSNEEVLFDGQSIIGKSREYVVALIGIPDYSDFSVKRKETIEQANYYINTCGNKLPGTVLVVFISNNKVIDSGFIIID